MAKFRLKSFVLLVVAATAGARIMWMIDDREAKNLDGQVFGALMKSAKTSAVDLHKLGFHGTWVDIHHDEDEGDMPSAAEKAGIAAADKVAKGVFTTPGGAYTAEDIAKNGTIPPYERFKDYIFMYSQAAKPGEAVDPLSRTRTSGVFDWYIGGKLFHFASIPTLEEFVMRAKKEPKSIGRPEDYVQKSEMKEVAAR